MVVSLFVVSSNHDRLESTVADDSKCWTSYVLPGYISSSLLDMFHYYNKFDREDGSNEKYKNNHLSHTDSGILTLVPCAAIPGLEVCHEHVTLKTKFLKLLVFVVHLQVLDQVGEFFGKMVVIGI